MSFCFKNQLNHLDAAHILVDGATRGWTKREILSLAKQLRTRVKRTIVSQVGLSRRCLLLCDGTSIDTAIYLAAVISGIAVVPCSIASFRKDPSHLIDSIKPALIVAPFRLHKDLAGILTGSVACQSELAESFDELTESEFESLEEWSIDLDSEAYVIATSGSTGRPKFVPITYRNILAWVDSSLPVLKLESSSRFGGTYPLYFDASAMFIFGCLFTGCSLILPEKEQTLKPLTYAAQARATHWATVPSAWEYSSRAEPNAPVCQSVHTVGLGGEVVSPFAAKKLLNTFPNAEVVDLYGPAEATIFIASSRLSLEQVEMYMGQTSLPLFPPDCPWMLDKTKRSDNEIKSGELLVGGGQVFHGYLHTNLWRQAHSGNGLFRTGDIFSYSDGMLHYVGRTDNQVKIRGQRITLEAIECAIQGVAPGLTGVCCRLSPGSDADIDVIYSGSEILASTIERELIGVLPLRIRIGTLVRVNALPITANGKVDRGTAEEMFAGDRN